jgi:hypothetical protein
MAVDHQRGLDADNSPGAGTMLPASKSSCQQFRISTPVIFNRLQANGGEQLYRGLLIVPARVRPDDEISDLSAFAMLANTGRSTSDRRGEPHPTDWITSALISGDREESGFANQRTPLGTTPHYCSRHFRI